MIKGGGNSFGTEHQLVRTVPDGSLAPDRIEAESRRLRVFKRTDMSLVLVFDIDAPSPIQRPAAVQKRPKTLALGHRQAQSRDLGNRWRHVVETDQRIQISAGCDTCRPAEDQRNPDRLVMAGVGVADGVAGLEVLSAERRVDEERIVVVSMTSTGSSDLPRCVVVGSDRSKVRRERRAVSAMGREAPIRDFQEC